jgi:hypothetical protein
MQHDAESPNHPSHQLDEVESIPVVPEYRLPFIASPGDVKPSPGSLDP